MKKRFHMILNVAVGGNLPGNPDASTQFPQKMTVDYVRVYQESTASTSKGVSLDNRISVYPNPANGVVNISTNLPVSELVLSDIYGKQVLRKSTHTSQLGVSNISPGTYFLTVYSKNQKVVKRIVVK